MRRRFLTGLVGGMILVIGLTYFGYTPWTSTEAAAPPPRPTIPATQTLVPSATARTTEAGPTSTPTPTPVLRLKFAPTIVSQPLY